MLPRWHILWGAVFTLLLWVTIPGVSSLHLVLVFAASFLIDFDHYVCAAMKKRSLSLFEAFRHHDEQEKIHNKERAKGLRKKGDFHLFHTVEFHVLIAILGIFWVEFTYVFIGMVFHSLLDIGYAAERDVFYRREFFFFKWLYSKF